jgi:predicted nucleic acid-binding protein
VILIDTNVLVDWNKYELDPTKIYGLSALSRAELEWGVYSAGDPHVAAKRIRKLNYFDARFNWIPFDVDSSRAYGLIAANAKGTGAKLRSKDALIAAQAHHLGGAVMTANRADFKPFEHLVEIIDPVRREN